MAFQMPVYILWALTSFFDFKFKERFKANFNKETRTYIFLLFAFIILHFFSFIISNDMGNAVKVSSPSLSIIVLPTIFLFANKNYREKYDIILLAFVIGNISALFICLINAFYQSTNILNGEILFQSSLIKDYSFFESFKIGKNHFSYLNFSSFKHPSYFAMYTVFSLGIILYLFKNNKVRKSITLILMSLMVVGIFLISSRAGIASVLLFIALTSYLFFKRKKRFKLKFLLTIFSLVVVSMLIMKITRIEKSFHILEDAHDKETRLELWDVSLQLSKEYFWIGAGMGDIEKVRQEKYNEVGMSQAAVHNLNSHNQFFETLLKGGIVFLIVLILLLLFPFIQSLKDKNYLLSLFIILLGFNFLLESMLERFQGVFFIFFFYCLFVIIQQSANRKLKTSLSQSHET